MTIALIIIAAPLVFCTACVLVMMVGAVSFPRLEYVVAGAGCIIGVAAAFLVGRLIYHRLIVRETKLGNQFTQSDSENAHRSPQDASDTLPTERENLRQTVVAPLLVVVVSPIAFCSVCIPVGGFGFGRDDVFIGQAIFTLAWAPGVVAGIGAGWLVYHLCSLPRERNHETTPRQQ